MTPTEALEKAAKILGGKAKMAALLGLTRQAVNGWQMVPSKHVLPLIELVKEASGETRRLIAGMPTAHDLRPDLFPHESGTSARKKGTGNGRATQRRST